jgi:coenzyme F420-reducing hydrogenase delta subunit
VEEAQFEPHIICFYCHNCTSFADEAVNSVRDNDSITLSPVKMPCTGKIEVLYLLNAFEEGADGVFVAGCPEGDCHYLEGNIRTKRRVHFAQRILDEIGVGGNRVHMYNIDPSEPKALSKVTSEIKDEIIKLGPSPLRRKGT